jgi:excisionase family DNA binding protein
MTVVQVSQRLGVSTATVYKLCNEGRLAHVRVLNAVRIARSALAALVSQARRRR